MKNLFVLVGIVFGLCVFPSSSAKSKRVKFGKIPKADLEAVVCPIDSNAHAYYIMDEGRTSFSYMQSKFRLITERHYRIKILDENALDYASIEIPLYSSGMKHETLSGVKAATYTLDHGELVVSKLDRKDILSEESSKHWSTAKFALQNVKKGAVIEVTYKITSDFLFNLRGWQFQYEIPVLSTDYRVEIPEYYVYKQYSHGYISYHTEHTSEFGNIMVDGSNVNFTEEVYHYTATDVPAFPVGRHLTSKRNYISHVDFELEGVSWPYEPYKSYTSTWTKIAQELLNHPDFGLRMNNTRCLKDQAELLSALSKAPNDRAAMAFAYIKGHTKWNGQNNNYTSQSLSQTMKSGVGNCCDINLSLVGLMSELGLEAYPVVLSTRGHGLILSYLPKLSQLNYVVAACVIDGKIYLMDATSDYSQVNILPRRCLNGRGLMLKGPGIQWVNLTNAGYVNNVNYVMSIDDVGDFSGLMRSVYKDYGAYMFRSNYHHYESKDKFLSQLMEDNAGLVVDSARVENVDSISKAVNFITEFKANDKLQYVGDLLLISPMLYDGMYENPLKLEKRMYPVEFYYPTHEVVNFVFTIPEGYTVESLPQSLMYKSESGTCEFKYFVEVQGNKVLLRSDYSRSQTVFPFNQYDELKSFFEMMVKKHNENIVLKKI